MKHRFKDTEALRKWLFARHAIQVAEAGEVLEN